MLKTIALSLCALLLGACSILAPQSDKLAKNAGKLVTFYCKNVTNPQMREEIRAAVNKYASPNSIVVTCSDGSPALISNKPTP